MSKLQDIGFYTLSDERVFNQSCQSPLWRCEMILTPKCNFNCPYCRPIRDDYRKELSYLEATQILDVWFAEGLRNVRFSGGEPTMFRWLPELVMECRLNDVERIAISTNGSADTQLYDKLICSGANDFSVSLDACCSSVGEQMCGGIKDIWYKVVDNIKHLSKCTYVTVGVVLNETNINQTVDIIKFADDLGVADIRIITAAQFGKSLAADIAEQLTNFDSSILFRHPILKYRIENAIKGRPLRGISKTDCRRCHLVLDDMAVAGEYHFPCIIYLREHGDPIGIINSLVREKRHRWFLNHDTFNDPICKNNCLDVCVDFNNKAQELKMERL